MTIAAFSSTFVTAAEPPRFFALITSGWNEKANTQFTIAANLAFIWRTGSVVRTGVVEESALAELMAHVVAAKPGPAANDVGTLQITWREKSGRTASKVFYFPDQKPASTLVQEISAIAQHRGR